MFTTSQLRVGTAFMYEGNALIVQKLLGQRSGRAGMVTNLRVKNLVTGQTMDLGLDAGEKFDEVDLDTHTTKLSYIDGEGDNALYVFMDQETYEQFELPKSDLGDNAGYITPEDDVEIEIEFVAVGATEMVKGWACLSSLNGAAPMGITLLAGAVAMLFIKKKRNND